MERIRMPNLENPFLPAINPHAAATEDETIQWASSFNLIRPADERRFYTLQYGILMGRAYPHAAPEALRVISDWNTWLFLLDDQCDEAGIGKQPQELTRLHQRFLKILRGDPPASHDGAAGYALADLCQRLARLAHPAWTPSFIQSVEHYFAANVWEAKNRLHRRIPAREDYLRQRPFTGGLDMYFHFIALARAMPPSYTQDHTLYHLARNTNHVICWSNDIFSLDKELRSGDVHNLALILHHELDVSLQTAVDLVGEQHNAEVYAFRTTEDRVPPDARWFADGLRSWMRANMDWSIATARYQPGVS
ncbi:MAG TPA: hypothetical protein VFZ66_00705 [Herpetosiphonaceae bacterium]